MEIEIRLLGPTEVIVDGKPCDLGGGRQRRLLTALAFDGGSVVSADRLIDRVWANGDLPANPRAALRTYLTRLRQAIDAASSDAGRGLGDAAGNEAAGGPIVTEAAGWRLDLGRATLDVTYFEEVVAAATDLGLDVHERLARFDRALALWRGRALEEVADDLWARSEVDRLEELRVTTLERRYEAMLAAGMHTDALPDLSGDVEQYPFRDRLVGLQMLALYRAGRQAEAGQVFNDHRTRLGEELGLEPSDDLIDLDRRILTADPSLQLGTVAGRALRGYRLGEQLGEGAFAVVYRGTQPSVGRDVAVKIIRSELANRPEFIRRFEAEAHLVARLEHPYIVPVYDYWREPDRACLVFRYLRGGTLEARLTAGGGLSIAETGRLVEQLSSALAVAHRAGVIHRDVKPANIFLDDNGNFYLGDFGIALEAAELSDPTAALSAGSPAYAAPEQLRRETIGVGADVHALAITTFEALTVRLPFPDAQSHADLLHRQLHDPIPSARSLRADIPAEVDDVLARATAKDPEERYGTIEDFAAAFAAAIATGHDPTEAARARRGATTAVSTGVERNPFKGLRAFTEADAADFRGRERLVDRLIELLSRPVTAGRIAAVVGPSGIGKSSVVRAGLLPALRQRAVPGSDRWFVATMMPGQDPFEELGSALLRIAATVPNNMMELLDRDHRGVARVVKALVPEDSEADVLLVIDQFEELFTLVEDEKRRHLFLDAIEHAVTDSRCPLRVVLTMRADFWDRPLRHGSFARLIEHSVVNVTALAPDELERAIVEPAAATGCEFEPGLVSEIVANVADEPGALPLLQYALTELWERRISGLLTRDAYRELGGVAGALALRAEELHDAATNDERTAIRRMFGRLVSLGEGTEDTRRRVLRSELTSAGVVDELIDRFGEARLLSFDRDPASREPTVEVAHEALIREWPRLGQWLEEDRDELRLHRHLATAATDWDTAGRPDSELYRGGRLEAAEEYASERGFELTDIESAFLAAAVGQQEVEEAAERERYETQVRNNRRLRGLLAGVGVLLALAVIAGGLAFQQRGQANLARDDAQVQAELASQSAAMALTAESEARQLAFDAETGRLVAEAVANVDADVDVALVLAAEAYRRAPGPETLSGLQRVLTSTGAYLGALGRGRDFLAADWLDDGTIVGLTEASVVLYDGMTHQLQAELPLDAPVEVVVGGTVQVAFDVSGQSIAVGTADGTAVVIDVTEDGPAVSTLPVSTAAISAIGLSPDGEAVAAADWDGELHLVDRASGTSRWRTEVLPERSFADVMTAEELEVYPAVLRLDDIIFGNGARDLAFEPAGSLLVSAGVHFRRLDLATGDILAEQVIRSQQNPQLPPSPRPAGALHVREDGSVVAIVGANGYVELDTDLDQVTGAIIATGQPFVNVSAFALGPDGVPTFSLSDGQLAVGVVESFGASVPRVVTGLATVRSLAVASHRGQVLAAGRGGLEMWALDGRQLLGRAVQRGGNNELAMTADGLLAVATNTDLGLESLVYDLSVDPPRRLELPPAFRDVPLRAGGDPKGRHILALTGGRVSAGEGDRAALIDRRTLEVVAELQAGLSPTLSDDGDTLVWGGFDDKTVARFRYPSGKMIGQPLDTESWFPETAAEEVEAISNLDLDASGRRLLISLGSGHTRLYDVDGWQLIAKISPDDDGGATTARFLPDGQTVVTRSPLGDITLRDGSTLEKIGELPSGPAAADTPVGGPFVSADGQFLLTAREQQPRMIHIPTGTIIGSFSNDPGTVVAPSDVGTTLRLMTGVGDHGIIWNLDVESWVDVACHAAGRNLTSDEWERVGPRDTAWRATCPHWGYPG